MTETRTLAATEVRFSTEDGGTFSGYASVFGEPDSFGDTIRPGAFQRTLAEHRARGGAPAMLWSHDPGRPVGVWTDLVEDERGLKVEGKLITATTAGREAHELLKAGAITGLSIGFRTKSAERGPKSTRTLVDLDLLEISLVTMPAASRARVTSVRNAAAPARIAAFSDAVRRTAQTIRGKTND